MAENDKGMRSLALTPTWSVASVLTIFVAVSLLVERSIHRLSTVSGLRTFYCWFHDFSFFLVLSIKVIYKLFFL